MLRDRRLATGGVAAFLLMGLVVVCAAEVLGDTPPSPYWRDTIVFPDDSFVNNGSFWGDIGWVKFTILLEEPDRVYFQDSIEYLFHYEFGATYLEPFEGMSWAEYDAATLYEAGQQAVLGAVVVPPTTGWPRPPLIPEYGIQFVRQDPYLPEEIVTYFELVRSKVVADPSVRPYYFPTFEQAQVAEENGDYFLSNGIEIGSSERWAQGNSCYSEGWAIGELKYFTGGEVEDAYLDGRLGPGDILLTDGVPAELPYLAGVITLSASTPNSHVAILSQTFGIPFAFAAVADDAALAQSLVGRTILFRAYASYISCDLDLVEVGGELTAQQIAEVLKLKEPALLDINPVATLGVYSANVDGLTLSDIQYFGGKASNFGFLRREIPNDSPVAMAFSFDVWNEFMNQVMPGGLTLGQEIDSVLSGYSYPPDFEALADDLDDIRELIKDDDETHFSAGLQSAILTALQDPQYGFDPYKKIRFRSSTNMEDTEEFVGAGLYDSYSGCLADDVDGDTHGPSICDPEESKERGVFRAIRKVFASFYNDNAFLERLRYGVNEQEVGMAVLVHHSFPDEIELANGVATSEVGLDVIPTRIVDHELVTQKGAVSVTNPEGGAVPEEVSVHVSSLTFPSFVSPSSLVPFGDKVMEWTSDYIYLAGLLTTVAEAYGPAIGETDLVLDFEYKKVEPGGGALPAGGIVVKQVRQLPQPDDMPSVTPFLVNEPVEYELFQGEFADVFANHRLKCRMGLSTKNMWMTEENLGDCFYDEAWIEYIEGDQRYEQTGSLSTWPSAAHAYDGEYAASDVWRFDHLANPRCYELTTNHSRSLVSEAESPVVVLRDLGNIQGSRVLELTVNYREPVPTWATWDGPHTTTEEQVRLSQSGPGSVNDFARSLHFRCPNGVVVHSEPILRGWDGSNLYTAPLKEFEYTKIEGLTSEPIVLTDYFSQTYCPGHHNVGDQFIFEPRVDPGVTEQQLLELEATGVAMIHAYDSGSIIVGYYDTNGVRSEQICLSCDMAGDLDCDGDVDLVDYGYWPDCLTGPGGEASNECRAADHDYDGDVDLEDFSLLRLCESGDLNCDGKIDYFDWEGWEICMRGPDVHDAPWGCWNPRFALADFDDDGDVDLQDFGQFAMAFSE